MATKKELEDQVELLTESCKDLEHEVALLKNELNASRADVLNSDVMLDELREELFRLEDELKVAKKGHGKLTGDHVYIDGKEYEILARHATKEFVNQVRLQYIPDDTTCIALKREGQ